MPSQDDAPQLVRWLFGHLRWTLKTKPQTSAQELLQTASVLPTAGPKLVLFSALAHQASPQLVRELLSALEPQRAAADLAQALQNLPQAQQQQALPLAGLLQQVLCAQKQFEVCVTVSTGPASELQREGHELCRSAAEQHVSELSNWPPAQKALLLRWALHSSSAATVPDSLRQAVISATQPSNSPSPSPAFGEAVMATAAEDGVKPHTLAGMVEEMGYACTASQRTFEEALQQAGPVDERGVAELLAMMARTHASLSDPHGSSSSVAAALSALGAGLGSSQGNGIWSSDQTWNMDLAVDVLRSKHPHLDWQQLPQQLDHPGFDLPDPKAFQALMGGLRRSTGQDFPVQLAVGCIWQNQAGQISFLSQATLAAPEVFTFEHAAHKQPPLEGLSSGKSPVGTPNQAWLCLDLCEVLCRLAEESADQRASVMQILDVPSQQCPELLVLGMASVRSETSSVQEEVCSGLLGSMVMQPTGDSLLTLRRLWVQRKDLIFQALLQAFAGDASCIGALLEVCNHVQGLELMLANAPPDFALQLAAAAASKDLLNMDTWLEQTTQQHKLPYAQAMLKFLEDKTIAGNAGTIAVSTASLAAVVRALRGAASSLPGEMAQEIEHVVGLAVQARPQLQQQPLSPQPPLTITPEIEAQANKLYQDVYDDRLTVEAFIAMLKTCQASADQSERALAASMLNSLWEEFHFFNSYPVKQLTISAALFGTIIQQRMVADIALLQGLQLLLGAAREGPDGKVFTLAVNAMRIFKDELLRWQEWPQWVEFSRFLLGIGPLREACPDVVEVAEKVLQEHEAAVSLPGDGAGSSMAGGDQAEDVQGQQVGAAMQEDQVVAQPSAQGVGTAVASAAPGPGTAPATPSSAAESQAAGAAPEVPAVSGTAATPPGPGRGAAADAGLGAAAAKTPRTLESDSASSSLQAAVKADPNRAFQAINAETLEAASLDVDFPEPPEGTTNRVAFLINNISPKNVDTKVNEMRELITQELWPWFANYMVVKRAAQEPNFHVAYVELLEKMDKGAMQKHLAVTTYKYIKVLLKSDRIKTQSGERTLLKNLGSWLGLLTIKQNRMVMQKDLDVKGLMFDAYEQGKMIAVLPFINRILEHCKDTRVFHSQNPWLRGILALAAEIYALERLKLNLKFDIETMFRNQGLSLSDVPPSTELSKHTRQPGENHDFAAEKVVPVEPKVPTTPSPPQAAGSAAARPTMQPGAAAAAAVAAAGPGAAAQGPVPALGVLPSVPRTEPEQKPAAGTLQGAASGPIGGAEQGLFANLHANVQINGSLGLIAERLQLKRMVPVAVDRAIVEIITPVVERSVTIACMTTQELIVKDFAMEPDEQRMRKAAHLMVSSLAGSLALVTCKDPLRVSLMQQMRNMLQSNVDPSTLEQTVQIITQDNLELGCTIIEKAATDKAIREIDERLIGAFQARQKARTAGLPFFDHNVLSGRFPSSLPDSLKRVPGHLNQQQQRVYEDFARIPRAAASAQAAVGGAKDASMDAKVPSSMHSGAGDDDDVMRLMAKYNQLQALLDDQIVKYRELLGTASMACTHEESSQALRHASLILAKSVCHLDKALQDTQGASIPDNSEMSAVIGEIVNSLVGPEESVLVVARRVFKRLYEGVGSRMHITAYTAVLVALRDQTLPKLPLELTRWWGVWFRDLAEDSKFSKDAGEALMRARLFNLPELDGTLACRVNMPQNQAALEFAVHVVRVCLVSEALATAADLFSTLDVLQKYAMRTSAGTAILQLVEQARQVARLRPPPAKEKVDPPGLRDKVAALFDEWAHLSEDQPAEKVHAKFVGKLQAEGFLKGDELTDRFLRILTELAVTHCLSGESGAVTMRPGLLYFVAIDAYVRLLVLLINAHGGGSPLLAKTMGVMANVLQRSADQQGGEFNSRPFFRICLGFISELAPSDPSDAIGFGMVAALATVFHALQPLRVPGFAFAWLELISHRSFMPKLLLAPGHKGWSHFQRLLVALLRFLEPYLRNAELTDAVRLLYKGTLRVLLVLLHDFPEFLCEYHFQLCDVVPPSCIQMRNLILSAFPRNMRLPDPFTPNLKVDLLPEITQSPRFLPEADNLLPKGLKAELDSYLKTRQPASFLHSLKQRLVLAPQDAIMHGTRYNVPLLNALAFYVGIQAVADSKQAGSPPVAHNPPMDIYQRLASELDTEGRYLFLNALANQLRYPNNHTHHFSCVLLYLFGEAQQEIVQEQITRVLLERLIVNRPHPWGLLVTFIELIKNPRYNFWSHAFTHCAGEIERLFESVARSCMGPRTSEEDVSLQHHQQATPLPAA